MSCKTRAYTMCVHCSDKRWTFVSRYFMHLVSFTISLSFYFLFMSILDSLVSSSLYFLSHSLCYQPSLSSQSFFNLIPHVHLPTHSPATPHKYNHTHTINTYSIYCMLNNHHDIVEEHSGPHAVKVTCDLICWRLQQTVFLSVWGSFYSFPSQCRHS